MTSETMQRGDVIEICQIHQFQGTKWLAAIVIEVRETSFAAQLIGHKSFPDGSNRIWLENHAKNRTWK